MALGKLVQRAQCFRDRWLEATGTLALGLYDHECGRLDAAEKHYETSRQIAARAGLRHAEAVASLRIGNVYDARSDPTRALAALDQAQRAFCTLGASRSESLVRIHRAGVEAKRGHSAQAHEDLARARHLLANSNDRGFRALCDVQVGQVELTEARARKASGERKAAQYLRASARRRLQAAKHDTVLSPCISSVPRCFEVRLVLRTLRESLDDGRRGTLLCREDGSAFQLGSHARVELPPGPSIRRVLHALAEARTRFPGKPLGVEDLLRRGWPGERVLPRAGRARVHVAVSRLRRMGLDDTLLTRRGGYLLDPDLPIAWERGGTSWEREETTEPHADTATRT